MFAGIAWLTSGPSAQGLGDVARREAERRQQVSGGKKYTNDNLQRDSVTAPAVPAAPSPSQEVPSAPAGSVDAKDAKNAKEGAATPAGESGTDPALAGLKTAEEKRGEEFWRGRAAAVNAQIDKANARVDGLKKRLDNLEAQLKNGAGTSHVQEREVTLKALEKAQYDARSMREEWDRLENRAKSEKVPLEWLR
jgi:hypothetical protein